MNTKTKSIILSLLVMLLWGSLFPCVKIGYAQFDINTQSIADILMFAAMRFTVCGLVVTLFCSFNRKKNPTPHAKSVLNILWIGVFAVVMHYALTYVGLSMTDSSKTALLKQSGALIYVCFAFLFFKDERFSMFRILGAIVGFGGIVAINFTSGGLSFSQGDVLILGASVCTVVSNVISRRSVQQSSPLWMTGISQLFGGLVLLMISVLSGGNIARLSVGGAIVFLYICTASVAGYTLWYYVLKTNELSKLFIVKFSEPLFACLFGAILLGENILRWQYLVSFLLISFGIALAHHKGEVNND